MQVQRLELVDFRSYERVKLEVPPGVLVLVGPNGQGKTNLIEALHRVATGTSHRVAGDAPLVRAGQRAAVVRLVVVTDDERRRTVEVELATGRRTRLRVDGQDVRRASEAVGVLRVVLFAPEDLRIVRGDPADRRRFLDDLLAQRRPAFAAVRSDYERSLRQRNQLLKRIRPLAGSAREAARATLAAWTEQLVVHGTQLVAARIAAVRTLAGPVDALYRRLADRPDPVALVYRSSAVPVPAWTDTTSGPVPDPGGITAALREELAVREEEELARGITLVGPHRDDLELSIGGLSAKGHASHGEAWSLALALKLATFDLLAEVGDRPIVLLDDVFAELDARRRERLAAACARFEQVIVTAAVEADVPIEGVMADVWLEDRISSLAIRPSGQQGAA